METNENNYQDVPPQLNNIPQLVALIAGVAVIVSYWLPWQGGDTPSQLNCESPECGLVLLSGAIIVVLSLLAFGIRNVRATGQLLALISGIGGLLVLLPNSDYMFTRYLGTKTAGFAYIATFVSGLLLAAVYPRTDHTGLFALLAKAYRGKSAGRVLLSTFTVAALAGLIAFSISFGWQWFSIAQETKGLQDTFADAGIQLTFSNPTFDPADGAKDAVLPTVITGIIAFLTGSVLAVRAGMHKRNGG